MGKKVNGGYSWNFLLKVDRKPCTDLCEIERDYRRGWLERTVVIEGRRMENADWCFF